MTYLFAVLAAVANAISSVLQRKADRDQPSGDNLSLRLIVDLAHRPVWFAGVLGVIAGFLLQAAALSTGPLAVVEPILIFELPTTLILAGLVFGRRLHPREWLSAAAMTLGLVGLLYFLSPSAQTDVHVPALRWAVGIAINLALIGALVTGAVRARRGSLRAAVLGVASGAAFGLTAALMKAMTLALDAHGFLAIFTAWPTYTMIVAGGLAMFLLQSSLNAGRLLAAQPGLTAADPIVSILWGTLAFGENVRGGAYLVLAVASAGVIGAGILGLARSPLVAGGGQGETPPSAAAGEGPA